MSAIRRFHYIHAFFVCNFYTYVPQYRRTSRESYSLENCRREEKWLYNRKPQLEENIQLNETPSSILISVYIKNIPYRVSAYACVCVCVCACVCVVYSILNKEYNNFNAIKCVVYQLVPYVYVLHIPSPHLYMSCISLGYVNLFPNPNLFHL